MEGIEMDSLSMNSFDEPEDLCSSILSRFSKSTLEDHQHLCTVIGAMSQELKDQNLPLTAIAYFGASCSSITRLLANNDSPNHIIDALVTILSLVLPRVSVAILRKKKEYVSELIVRFIAARSLSVNAAAAGLKCVSHMLMIGDDRSWPDVSQLYGVLLSHMTDSRPKVRRQSHICLHDVLQRFGGTVMLVPASEGITSIFERFLLLAGGSNANGALEGPKGAQEVLYVLDALKDCLLLLSNKCITTILKYYKTLLELRQPLVTRRITESLNVFCLDDSRETSPEPLLDLLCSLALTVSTNETTADGMTFTARLLGVGMKKIYTLNRQICVIKLPLAFKALIDILAFEHEEAIFAAVDALKNVIHTCIDESLIKQGVDQMAIAAKADARRLVPTIIEKVCATIESLLDYRYAAVWDMSFQVVSTMFDKLGRFSSSLLRGTLKNLAGMQKLPDEDFPYRKQLHQCIGSALGATGPQTFLDILPLNLETEDQSEANIWLFPILKQYTVGANLSFFTDTILVMIGQMKKKSHRFELEGRVVAARNTDALVYSLWSLLPSFCDYPLDTAEGFMDLEKELCISLREEPDVRGIICSSLQILIRQNKKSSEEDLLVSDLSIHKQRAMAHYTSLVTANNMTVIKACGRELLSTLSGIFMQSTKDDGGCLQSTINEIASISDKEVVSRLYKNTMHKLLKVTQEAIKVEKSGKSMQIDNPSNSVSPMVMRAQLFDLAVSLLPGLNSKEIELLFVAIEPALRDSEGLIQKKAYKVLSIVLQNCDGFLSAKLEQLLQLMIEVLASCHFSAKRHRLHCLYFLVVHIAKDASEQKRRAIISSFLTEIILSLKEANKKTRNKAYDMLVQIGHACCDEEKGGKMENLHQYFNMVAGGLAGENPHMISAAVKGLARLAYEFSDLVSAAYNVLPSTFLLLKRKNREIVKANLGLLKVLVAKSQAEGLQTHLRSMLEGLLQWQDSTKNHFKAKIKNLLEMLVKKCGLEAVKAAMPEEHMKLLTNIRKINERKEKKRAANSELRSYQSESRSYQSKATTSRLSRWNHTKIFSDFSDEENGGSDADYMDTKTTASRRSKGSLPFNSKSSLRSKRTRNAAKSLSEDLFDQLEDEPLDLLDRHKTRSALRSSEQVKRKVDSDDELEIDPDGRLIIHDGYKKKKETHSDLDTDTKSEAGSNLSSKTLKQTQKRRKTSDSGWAYTGKEYTSKKAVGDVKRKDKLEPYAYWPLDRKMMSRRPEHRATARKGMTSVVNLTKKLEGKSASVALSMKGLKFKRSQKNKGKKIKSK